MKQYSELGVFRKAQELRYVHALGVGNSVLEDAARPWTARLARRLCGTGQPHHVLLV